MWFSNAHIVDVAAGEVLRNRHFNIVDGIITDIQQDAPVDSTATTDLGGHYVMPGII